jgi:hypothetical protein
MTGTRLSLLGLKEECMGMSHVTVVNQVKLGVI